MATIRFEDLVHALNTKLYIPTFAGTESVLDAGMAYGEAGWFMVPIRAGSKHPGSVLGKNWPEKSSRDPQVLSDWFRNSDFGIALHTGKSNCCVFDVDYPDRIPAVLSRDITNKGPAFQSTRINDLRRGHYAYSLEYAATYSTSNGTLGTEWGEVRTGNSVIVAYPTPHKEQSSGGRYLWIVNGELPTLPNSIKNRLKSGNESSASQMELGELQTWLEKRNGNSNPQLLQMRIEDSLHFFRSGSRHNACLQLVLLGLKDSAVGHYPASLFVESALAVFLQFKPEEEWSPRDEFVSIVRWAASVTESMTEEELARHLILSDAYASPGISAWVGGNKPWN